MRDALRPACIDNGGVLQRLPDHIGLAYGPWAPTAENGKVPDTARPRWFGDLASVKVPDAYRQAFQTWEASFNSDREQLFELALTSRLLIGHGNASAAEVGVTVHHTWGVPIITGSALKGLCAHYTATIYGPDAHVSAPWTSTGLAAERARYPLGREHDQSRARRCSSGAVRRARRGRG
jgi:CRISPR-associated protein Cmr6